MASESLCASLGNSAALGSGFTQDPFTVREVKLAEKPRRESLTETERNANIRPDPKGIVKMLKTLRVVICFLLAVFLRTESSRS